MDNVYDLQQHKDEIKENSFEIDFGLHFAVKYAKYAESINLQKEELSINKKKLTKLSSGFKKNNPMEDKYPLGARNIPDPREEEIYSLTNSILEIEEEVYKINYMFYFIKKSIRYIERKKIKIYIEVGRNFFLWCYIKKYDIYVVLSCSVNEEKKLMINHFRAFPLKEECRETSVTIRTKWGKKLSAHTSR